MSQTFFSSRRYVTIKSVQSVLKMRFVRRCVALTLTWCFLWVGSIAMAVPAALNPNNATTHTNIPTATEPILVGGRFIITLDSHQIELITLPFEQGRYTDLSIAGVRALQVRVQEELRRAYDIQHLNLNDPVPSNIIQIQTGDALNDFALAGGPGVTGGPDYAMRWGDISLIDLALSAYLRRWSNVDRTAYLQLRFYEVSHETGALSPNLLLGCLRSRMPAPLNKKLEKISERRSEMKQERKQRETR